MTKPDGGPARLRQVDVSPGMEVICVEIGTYAPFLKAGKRYTVRAKRKDTATDIWLHGIPLSFKASRFIAAPAREVSNDEA